MVGLSSGIGVLELREFFGDPVGDLRIQDWMLANELFQVVSEVLHGS